MFVITHNVRIEMLDIDFSIKKAREGVQNNYEKVEGKG